jgi:hypothetical protein
MGPAQCAPCSLGCQAAPLSLNVEWDRSRAGTALQAHKKLVPQSVQELQIVKVDGDGPITVFACVQHKMVHLGRYILVLTFPTIK